MTTGISREQAELLLMEEARLIDERRFDEWLALFTPDCRYWLPITDGDPEAEPSLIYDDFTRMQERVFRLVHTHPPSQEPPSRTLHNVSNVQVLDGKVTAHLTIFEFRPGDPSQVGLGAQRVFAGSAEYVLTGGPRWRIKLKKVWLLNRDAPHYNLTFIF
ncbi:MAG TPA: aromatic-ring-hydroxylating dioxygenase subunit beta [Chloroflexota bacterium]